jgi:hypothetical protein
MNELSRDRDLLWRITHLCILLNAGILGLKLALSNYGRVELLDYLSFLFHYVFPIFIILFCIIGNRIVRFVGERLSAKRDVLLGIEREMGLGGVYEKHFPPWVSENAHRNVKFPMIFTTMIWVVGIFAIYVVTDGGNLLGLIIVAIGIIFDCFFTRKLAKYQAAVELSKHFLEKNEHSK